MYVMPSISLSADYPGRPSRNANTSSRCLPAAGVHVLRCILHCGSPHSRFYVHDALRPERVQRDSMPCHLPTLLELSVLYRHRIVPCALKVLGCLEGQS
eukprot:IDg16970t1